MNDWRKLAALAHEALLDCKRATERGSQPPSARLELVRDYSTPAIVALQNAFKAERKVEREIKRAIWASNAALITTAPDLLEACELLCPLTHYDSCEGLNFHPVERESHCTCGAAKARSAIAKAKGQEEKP